MSELATRTMLTRSGVTGSWTGLHRSVSSSASRARRTRVSHMPSSPTRACSACAKRAAPTPRASRATFLRHFSEDEVAQLADLLGRLPGVDGAPACTVE